jgi:hypothetical protein
MCFGGGGSKNKKPAAPVPPEQGYQKWMNESNAAKGLTDPGPTQPGTSIAGDLGAPIQQGG